MPNLDIENAIEQAGKTLEAVYAEIIVNTDLRTLKVNPNVFRDLDKKKLLMNLHKISITCRRLETELKEAQSVEIS